MSIKYIWLVTRISVFGLFLLQTSVPAGAADNPRFFAAPSTLQVERNSPEAPMPLAQAQIPAFGGSIKLITGTVSAAVPIQQAVIQALATYAYALPQSDYFAITDIQLVDKSLLVSVAGLVSVTSDLNWNIQDNGTWFGLVALQPTSTGEWLGAVEGTSQFSQILAAIPNTRLSSASKTHLDPTSRPLLPASAYRFPWPNGSSMQYGSEGVHDNGFASVVSGWRAVDFLSDGNTGAGHAANNLLAAAAGTISYRCSPASGQNTTAIKIDNLMYTHLFYSSSLYVGASFNQGDSLGQLRPGTFNENCGYATQGSNWFHVHWGFPNTGSFQAENWTLSFSDQLWRSGSDTRGTGSWFQAGGNSDTAPPDSDFTSPSNNSTITSQTAE